MTEYQKWHAMIDAYEKILHPDLFLPIKRQLQLVYDECKENAFKAANISEEAREIDMELQKVKKSIQQIGDMDPTVKSFMLKQFSKFLINKLG